MSFGDKLASGARLGNSGAGKMSLHRDTIGIAKIA
jgi:hypothetical protein